MKQNLSNVGVVHRYDLCIIGTVINTQILSTVYDTLELSIVYTVCGENG